MDAGGAILSMVITLVTVVIVLCSTLLSVAVPILIVAGVLYLVVKNLDKGGTLVVSGPLVDLAAASAMTASKPAGPKQIKRVSCRTCGAAKMVPPRTAYLYCDYCGSLTDWDFKLACSAGSAKPGPAYEALLRQKGPALKAAKDAGDVDAYRQLQVELFTAHANACPAAYSPRLGDPEYKDALINYQAELYSISAFDEEASRKELEMNAATGKLAWNRTLTSTTVESTSFWNLFEAFMAHQSRFLELGDPILHKHPDEASRDLMLQIGASAFAQGWMPYLPREEQDRMIERLGLKGEYVPIEPIDAEDRHCGACNRELKALKGARKVLCEACGHMNDFSQPEIQCTSCASPVSVPWGKMRFSCPNCDADLRAEGG